MPRSLLSRLVVLVLAALLLGMLVQGSAQARKKLVYRSVTLYASAGAALVKAPITFSGRVTRSPKGSLISVQRRSGKTWVTVKQTRTTTAAGAYRTAVTMPGTAGTYSFRALAVKKGKLRGALSRTVGVKAMIKVTATLTASATKVPAGSQITVTGTVKPFKPLALIQIQKQVKGVWTNYASTAIQSNGTFSRAVYVGPTTPLRVSVLANGFYAAAYSATVTVRTTPVIATSELADARQFQAYNAQLTTIDGAQGTWSVNPATPLPPGLTLHPTTGVLSGTPNNASLQNVGFSFTSSLGETAPEKTIQVKVLPSTTYPTIITTALPDGVRTEAYDEQLTASGPGPDRTGTWAVKPPTALPPGLSLNPSNGRVTGVPTALGQTSVSVTYTQSNTALSVTKTVSITITQVAAPAITTNALTGGTAGSAYSLTLAATGPNGNGGAAAATGTWTASALPAGLDLNPSTGAITGTPTTAGETDVVIGFTQTSTGLAAPTKSLTLAVKPAVTTSSLDDGTVGTAYSESLAAAGGNGGTWTATPRPAGISINASTGELTGTPTTAGSTNVVVTYTVNGQTSASTTLTLAVKPTVTTTSLDDGTVGTAYSESLAAAGGNGGTWTATPRPAGISINASTGELTGTPTTAGSTDVVVTYTVNGQTSASTTLTLDVKPAVTTTSLDDGLVGTAYSESLAAAGGSGGTWTATPRPAGISINASTGELTGTPTTAGSTDVVVTYTVNGQTSASTTLALAVKPTVSTSTLPAATTGAAYSVTLAALGGSGGTWTATPLPAGITLDPDTGELSGTPTTAGSTNVVVTYTVNGQTSASKTLALAVKPVIVTASLPSGTRTEAYSFTLDGSQNGTWTATPLPDGLSLNPSSGAITGTPTTVGSTNVTIGYTVNGQTAATKTLALVVDEAPAPVITTTSLTDGTEGEVYSQQVLAQGNPAGTWSTEDPLPDGLSIGAGNGTISGTPTVSGTFSVKVLFTQTSTGLSTSKTFTLHLEPAGP